MNSQTSANTETFPVVALLLGYSGVIPFVALAVGIATGVDFNGWGVADAHSKLVGYAAVIVSFIGAVHWGVALQAPAGRQNQLFIYSVLPALAAWVWMFFTAKSALIGMALTIVALYFVDRGLLQGLVHDRYVKMRMHLTIIVALSLLVAAVGIV